MREFKAMLLLGIIACPVLALTQEVHPEIQTVLDWQLPKNPCEFKLKRSNVTSDMDRKYKKLVKKYQKCASSYLTGLTAAQENMMAVAKHGLTREQADIVMRHITIIKTVKHQIESQTAKPEEDVPMDTREFVFRGHH